CCRASRGASWRCSGPSACTGSARGRARCRSRDRLPPAAEADSPPVRDAATLILVRRTPAGPEVLMGLRGGGAAFMPEKFVFPGGAVDPDDALLDGDPAPDPQTERSL